MSGIGIKKVSPSDVELLRSTRLASLADAPDAFSATLVEAQSRPPDWWATQASGSLGDNPCATFVALTPDGVGVGMAAGVAQTDAIEIIQVWVAPPHRGTGLVDRLFAAIFDWSPHPRVDIAVASTNIRALRAYERLGFGRVGERADGAELVLTCRRGTR